MTRGGPEALADVPLFAGLTKRHLRHIAGLTEEESFPEGSTLAEEGTPGETFHIMLEGEAKVTRGSRRINRLLPGDFFGEIALITGGVRTATVTTTSPVRALVLTDRAFRSIVNATPSVQGSVMKALAERLHADSL